MVDGLNGLGKQGAQEKAQRGHQGLEAAEPQAAGHARLQRRFLHSQAFADGNRKGIHADTHCQQQQFSNTHKKQPPYQIRNLTSTEVKQRRDWAGLQKSRHFRLNRGFPSMSIQPRGFRADYSLFSEDYSKIPPVSQAKPGGRYNYFTIFLLRREGRVCLLLRRGGSRPSPTENVFEFFSSKQRQEPLRQQHRRAAADGHHDQALAPVGQRHCHDQGCRAADEGGRAA